jgi:hypothetical protein
MSIWNLFGNRKNSEPVRLQSTGSLGLIPSQIIYVEGTYNQYVNTFIKDRYDELANGCARKGFDFVYFPKMEKDFSHSKGLGDLLQYVYPWLPQKLTSHLAFSFHPHAIQTKRWLAALGYEANIQPGLFRLTPHPESAKTFVFEYFPFNLSKKKTLLQQWENYIATLPFEIDEPDIDEPDEELSITPSFHTSACVSVIHEERAIVIPAAFYSREYDVVEKIKRNIHEAKQLGIYEEVIK